MNDKCNSRSDEDQTQEQGAEFTKGWYDAVYRADYHFKLSDISWCEAAVLLSGRDPLEHNSIIVGYEFSSIAPPDTEDKMLNELIRRLSAHREKRQSLWHWIELVRSNGIGYDRWIDEYLAFPGAIHPSQMNTGELVAKANQNAKPVAPKQHLTYLAELIENWDETKSGRPTAPKIEKYIRDKIKSGVNSTPFELCGAYSLSIRGESRSIEAFQNLVGKAKRLAGIPPRVKKSRQITPNHPVKKDEFVG